MKSGRQDKQSKAKMCGGCELMKITMCVEISYRSIDVWDSSLGEIMIKRPILSSIKIVFCGKGHFVSSYEYTKEYLQNESINLVVEQCQYDNLEDRLKGKIFF